MSDMTPAKATALRKPFPPESVGKLPKGGVMLDYVGHAAVTDRLLIVDPDWSWEPLALSPEGLPALDRVGNLWIKLTVCGVTRIGVGDGKNAKECIGDALRNAAMRFGVALDLWAKENLVEFAQQRTDAAMPPAARPRPTVPALAPGVSVVHAPRPREVDAREVAERIAAETGLATAVAPPEQLVGGDVTSEGEAGEAAPAAGDDAPAPSRDEPGSEDPGGSSDPEAPQDRRGPRKASRSQLRMIEGVLTSLGVDDDRDERHLIAGALAARAVTSFNDLTSGDASKIIDTLARIASKEALSDFLDALDDAKGDEDA